MNRHVYAGPARVVSVERGLPRVQLLAGACEVTVAEWALPFRYDPAVGDLLMVLGRQPRFWVTGVVQGAGRSELVFRGDTELRAAGGPILLSGDGGVRVQAPEVHVEADEFESETTNTHQRIDNHDSEVAGALDERAGECLRDIDGEDSVTAARTETVAAKIAKVDGNLLRLS